MSRGARIALATFVVAALAFVVARNCDAPPSHPPTRDVVRTDVDDRTPRGAPEARPTPPATDPASNGANASAPPPTDAQLIGRVVDDLWQPIADCEVLLTPLDLRLTPTHHDAIAASAAIVRTGTDGRFTLALAPERPHVLVLRHLDFPLQLVADGLVVPAGERRDLGDVALHARAGLTVRVFASDGSPLVGARVQLTPADGASGGLQAFADRPNLRCLGVTDESGRATLSGVLPTVHVLRVEAPEHAVHEQEYVHAPHTWPEVLVRLANGHALRGTVRDASGLVPPDTRVEAELDDGRIETTPCAPDGSFRLAGLRAGPARLWLHADHLGRHPATTLTIGDDVGELRLNFPRLPELAGRVTDVSGRPIRDARIRIDVPGAAPMSHGVVTGPDGAFRCAVARRCDLVVAADGYPITTFGPFVPPIEGLALSMSRGATVSGRAVGPRQEPVVAAKVELLPASHDGSAYADVLLTASGGPAKSATTDAEGRFVLRGVGVGNHRIRITMHALPAQASAPFDVVAGQTEVALDAIALRAGNVVSGRVLDDDGSPVPFALVRIEPHANREGAFVSGAQIATDRHGRFTSPRLLPGRYAVAVVPTEGSDLASRVDVASRSRTTVTVADDEAAVVELRTRR
jgi:protocatechuate 3,4-dioxygenase beta subunit